MGLFGANGKHYTIATHQPDIGHQSKLLRVLIFKQVLGLGNLLPKLSKAKAVGIIVTGFLKLYKNCTIWYLSQRFLHHWDQIHLNNCHIYTNCIEGINIR